ncbi:DUF192 domain-containing protein [Thioalkalicoccus limnaeus]|uniref:DUF192 domain-containing protein n=1 Tax=Thioalkalicoccus limnaeus TaxID=120681 RepID=A0ABV4BHC2_9GAMM
MPQLSRRLMRFLVLFCLMPASVAAEPRVAEISVGAVALAVELAYDESSRQLGLMHREFLPADRGMLFIFPLERRHCMWMRNTWIPLSVAFVSSSGRVLNIADMTPLSDATHCAAAPARYALEVNQGWFDGHGIAPGQLIEGLESLPVAR